MKIDNNQSLIAVEPSPQNPPGFVVTLEGTSLVLTILVSSSVLLAGGVKLISKFNIITSTLRDLREDLNAHSNAEGHIKILEQVKLLQKDVCGLDKRFEIHLQDYVNYKDATLLTLNGYKERIEHKAERLEEYRNELKSDIKELQGFLVKHDFKIRG